MLTNLTIGAMINEIKELCMNFLIDRSDIDPNGYVSKKFLDGDVKWIGWNNETNEIEIIVSKIERAKETTETYSISISDLFSTDWKLALEEKLAEYEREQELMLAEFEEYLKLKEKYENSDYYSLVEEIKEK